MAKLGCICGHTIVDQTDNISYKASFIRDQDIDTIDNLQADDINDFINAIINNERDKWLKNYFCTDAYKNLKNSVIIQDIMSRHSLKYESEIFLCEECGRIKIQKGTENKFISFSAEDNQWIDIFKGLPKT
jgi:hypothetical protein